MYNGCDMIVNLQLLPQMPTLENIKIKRAFVGDKEVILKFVDSYFQKNWVYEVEKALMSHPSKCFIATQNGEILGFACYDSSAKGFFGPIGTHPDKRKMNIGKALLIRALEAMKEDGYGYAIIGWVSEAETFYRKTVHAEFVPGGTPDKSVYTNLVSI